jgi:hypothetical protein
MAWRHGRHGVWEAWGQTEFQVNLKLGLTPRDMTPRDRDGDQHPRVESPRGKHRLENPPFGRLTGDDRVIRVNAPRHSFSIFLNDRIPFVRNVPYETVPQVFIEG